MNVKLRNRVKNILIIGGCIGVAIYASLGRLDDSIKPEQYAQLEQVASYCPEFKQLFDQYNSDGVFSKSELLGMNSDENKPVLESCQKYVNSDSGD